MDLATLESKTRGREWQVPHSGGRLMGAQLEPWRGARGTRTWIGQVGEEWR